MHEKARLQNKVADIGLKNTLRIQLLDRFSKPFWQASLSSPSYFSCRDRQHFIPLFSLC